MWLFSPRFGLRLAPLAALLGGLLSGCASVPLAPANQDARAREFQAVPGSALLYLYRDEIYGGAARMTVTLNGRVAGNTGPKTYFLWQVEPGLHEVSSHAENTATLRLNLEAGKTYFVRQEVKMGLVSARSKLYVVDAETGRNGVNSCRLAYSPLAGPRQPDSNPLIGDPNQGKAFPAPAPENPPGQSLRDVVHLKGGGIIKGVIVEQIVGKSLKIETRDGSIHAIEMDAITKIVKEDIAKAQGSR